MDMSTHGSLGTSKGIYNPCGKTLDLAFLHIMHLPHIRVTSLLFVGQKKCSCKISNVFLTPKCPINPHHVPQAPIIHALNNLAHTICFLYTNNHHACKTYQILLNHTPYTHQKNQRHWHTPLSHIQTQAF